MGSTKSSGIDKKAILHKLTKARANLVEKHPFFGVLVMSLKLSLAKIGTAATDMEKIMWDPDFVIRLSDEEIQFVMMHEVLHCALDHCIRCKEYNDLIYNIASDIVVNSSIMRSMGVSEFILDGASVMHLTPDGTEGYMHTAEEVYMMLCDKDNPTLADALKALKLASDCNPSTIDNHGSWKNVSSDDAYQNRIWKEMIKKAISTDPNYSSQISSLRRLMEGYNKEVRINWKEVLHDFIHAVNEGQDYVFAPYDRRFSESDFMLPSLGDIETEAVNNIWFVVDVSASMNDEELSTVMGEINSALEQIPKLEGALSFFDTKISAPIKINGAHQQKDLTVRGGGGTSFYCIFDYLKEQMTDNLPTAIIIMTDGYADYPPESMALGVPVLWILTMPSREVPWGMVTSM